MRYGVALMTVLLAWPATVFLQSVMPERSLSLIFFFGAIALSAGIGGLWAGLLATILSALICDYFFLAPVHSLALARGDHPIFVLLILVALLINGLSGRMHAKTRAADMRFQRISRKLVRVQEDERRKIARELHDEIGQALTSLKYSMELCVRSDLHTMHNVLRESITLATELMDRVSELSLELRPAMLDDLGLLPTLLWQFERFSALTGVHVTFEQQGVDRRFPTEVETTAYRIVQEGLTNVARHAEVSEVEVGLRATPDVLRIEIRDRGHGFNPETVLAAVATAGLVGMSERASLIDGRLVVDSSPGTGTCLTAELPLAVHSPEAETK